MFPTSERFRATAPSDVVRHFQEPTPQRLPLEVSHPPAIYGDAGLDVNLRGPASSSAVATSTSATPMGPKTSNTMPCLTCGWDEDRANGVAQRRAAKFKPASSRRRS